MITLRKIARLIWHDVDGGDPSSDSRLNEKYIILRVRQKLQAKMKIQRFERMKEGDNTVMAQYIYTYTGVEVQGKSGGGYPYIDLPDFYPSLPYNKGIKDVCPNEDLFNPYIRKNNPSVTMGLKCGELQGKLGWWPEGLKVYFDKDKSIADTVAVKLLLPAPDAIGEDDPLPVTPEIQDEIIIELKQELGVMPIQDNINDNNPDIGTRIDG